MMKTLYTTGFTGLLFCALLVVAGCGNDDEGPDLMDPRGQQLRSVYENGVVEAHTEFIGAAAELNQRIMNFAADPTENTLSGARSAWSIALLKWKRCEIYDFGSVSNFFLHTRVHRWPVDAEALEGALVTDEEIDGTYIRSRGSSIVGLAAVEYLLFAEDEANTVAAFTGNEARRKYLAELADYLLLVGEEVQLRWTQESAAFVSSTGRGIDAGQNVLTNGLINYLDKTMRFRLRTPSGEQEGGDPDPSLTETPFARESITALWVGFNEWKRAYYGGSVNQQRYGYPEFLTELGADAVAVSIDDAIRAIDNRFVTLRPGANNDALEQLLVIDPEEINRLANEFQDLLVLLRVDVVSRLDLILTVTDADGD